MLYALLLSVAFAVGFAAHQASLCTVKAVAEIMTSGRARILTSFLKAAAWAALVSGAVWFASDRPGPGFLVSDSVVVSVCGGFAFGLGAAINGGCALSTLQRLANGELSMFAGIAAAAVGTVSLRPLLGSLGALASHAVPPPWAGRHPWAAATLVLLFAWGTYEVHGLIVRRARPRDSMRPAIPRSHRLSGAAFVMGIGAGLLYALQGNWTFGNLVRVGLASREGTTAIGPTLSHAGLVVALFGGMVLSSVRRGSLALRSSPRGEVARRITGGYLMGVGGTLIPGGNDSLILVGLPTLASQAFLTYAALLGGVAAALWSMRRTGYTVPVV